MGKQVLLDYLWVSSIFGRKEQYYMIARLIRVCLILLIILLNTFCFSQSHKLSFDNWGMKEGLPADGVHTILQDYQGYIWIGTLNGLIKYDGYQFKIYRSKVGDTLDPMPVGRDFTSLLLAKSGTIWMGTLNNGFSFFDVNTERFTNFPNKGDSNEANNFFEHKLLIEDSQHRIWMYAANPITKKSVLKNYNPLSKTVSQFNIEIKTGHVTMSGLIVEDKLGNIWSYEVNKGVYRLSHGSEDFKLIHSCNPEGNTPLASSKIVHLMIDTTNQMWISTNKGLHIYDLKTKKWIQIFDTLGEQDFISQSILYTFQNRQGNIWIFVEGKGLMVYKPKSKSIEKYVMDNYPFSTLEQGSERFIIRPVLESNEGIWFINDLKRLSIFARKFFYYDYGKKVFSCYGENFNQPTNLTNEAPITFLVDNSGLIWIGNINRGLNRQNLLVQQIDQWDYNPSGKLGLTTDTILNVKEDQQQQIWILGQNKLQKYNPQKLLFEVYQPYKNEKIIFNSFQEDKDGNLWIGSNQGLYKFNKENHEFVLVLPLFSNEENAIVPVFLDKTNKLWIKYMRRILGGEYGKALGIIDLNTENIIQKFEYDLNDSTSLVGDLITDILLDTQGRVWVATFKGLCRYDFKSTKFKQYKHRPNNKNTLSNNFVSFIYEDSKSNIWVGTFNQGLNLYNEKEDNFKHWKDKNGFMAVLTALEGKDGNLWLGTYRGEGLFKMNPDTKELKYYNKTDGLASDRVVSIIEDDFGYLWIPSESGLSRFDPKTETFKVYNEDDGFATYDDSNVPQYAKPFKASNGDIWLNTYTKLMRIQPKKLLQADSTLPIVHIRALKIGNETYGPADGDFLKEHISNTESLELEYHQNDLTFEYVGLHYARPADNQYSYKLEGFDEDWSLPSYDRKARYAGLPPGNYTFRVKASNADGVWNEEGASIQIMIAQAWWKTAWAFIIYLILLGVVVYYVIRWRTKKQEAKILAQEKELARERELSERLKAVDQLKDQFLANTSHELRTPLNGIIGLSEGIYDRVESEADKEDLELIISSGKRLHYLVDDILDFSKLKNADFEIDKKPINLKSVVALIFRMNKPAIKEKPLELVNDIPEDFPAVLADADRLQQILYNLVGNAVKFTEKGEIKVSAEINGHQIKIKVSDTGPGIPADKQAAIFEEFQQADGSISRKFGGTGLGLSITKQLVALHGGSIGVDSKVGKGSTFWFTLDVSEETGEIIQTSDGGLATLTSRSDDQNFAVGSSSSEVETAPIPAVGKIDHSQRIRILIVDDEPVNQRVIKNHLNSDRFELAFADDGDAALAIMEKSPMFDLVLLDVMMPNMSGYEVCRRIREKYLPSELPVIMVTAKNQVTDLVQGLNRGANDYLAKPFSKQEFLARVNTQIDLHHIFNITDRFIPNEFIRSLGHDRITEVQLGDLVERVVSVLFTDIRSYTTLSEAMTPEDTFRFINGYTNRMGPIIHKNNGFVNQYLGDGIMAIFQYSADDALEAMIGMQIKLREYNIERAAKNRPLIAVGMGLHTGPLIMGIIGDTRRTDAATISDTVNTAARMEGLTKGFGVRILISGSSYKSLKNPDKYHFRFIGKVKVKGKNESVDVYECIDGDPPDELEMKWKLKEGFDVAVTHFYGKKYEETLMLTKQIIEQNPKDRVAKYFYEKSLERLENGE